MMNNPPLDPLLEACRRRKLPSAPTDLESNVWREIRRRATAPETSWYGYLDWVFDRRMVTACLVAAVFTGILFNLQPKPVSTRQAMGLAVFSHNAYSPLARFAQNP